MRSKIIGKKFFLKNAKFVAPRLLGKVIIRKLGRKTIEMIITETEAYLGEKDLASHARFGKTNRNYVMFESGGVWYVYLVYGIHWLLNIVTGRKDTPSGVLIRGGIVLGKNQEKLKGPGRITNILKIGGKFSGKPSNKKTGLWLEDRGIKAKTLDIRKLSRVGVNYAGKWAHKRLRFVASSLLAEKAIRT
jgi:DNA-3-methyladenine glycosylase